MADKPRHTRPDLNRVDAFELLRQLETEALRFGRAGGPEREPARLGQGARLSFAAADVADMTPADCDSPARVAINVLGLLGPEGPMPLHLTQWVFERLSNRWFAGTAGGATTDTAFLDFANLLQHRHIALYWRAWADTRPEVQLPYGTGGSVPAVLRALAGTGLPGTDTGSDARQAAKMRHATSLALSPRGPERLLDYLSDVVGAKVRLTEFVGVWTAVPEHLATRLGDRATAQLGKGAMIGPRVFERQSRAELRIGPMTREKFLAWLDDDTCEAELRHALLFAMGHEIAFDLRLVLAAAEVPQPRLGGCRLGRTTWLDPIPGRDADDLRLSDVAHRGRLREAA